MIKLLPDSLPSQFCDKSLKTFSDLVAMSEDERDIDVELDDGDLGGMDDEGGSLAGDDGIPENKR